MFQKSKVELKLRLEFLFLVSWHLVKRGYAHNTCQKARMVGLYAAHSRCCRSQWQIVIHPTVNIHAVDGMGWSVWAARVPSRLQAVLPKYLVFSFSSLLLTCNHNISCLRPQGRCASVALIAARGRMSPISCSWTCIKVCSFKTSQCYPSTLFVSWTGMPGRCCWPLPGQAFVAADFNAAW